MSVYDRWHLAHPPAGAGKCPQHRKVPSAAHGKGLRWQVRGQDPDGRPYKESFEYEQAARDKDAELRAAVRAGTFVDERAGAVTFRQYAEQWCGQQSHGYATAERARQMLRNHCYEAEGTKGKTPTGRMAIGGYPMAALARRVTLLRDWITDLALHPNTARLLIDTVTAVFDAAIDDRIIGRNPLKTKSVSKPKRVKAEVTAWPAAQVELVAQALADDRMRAMVYLAAVTGMRQGELFGLAVDDVDFLRRWAHVEVQVAYVGGRRVFAPLKNHKRRKSRDVPVAAPVVPVLAEHVRKYPPAAVTLPWSEKGGRMDGKPVTRRLLFTDDDGMAYHRQTVNRVWRPAWRAAGVPDLGRANGMHVLRHTAASRWLSGGLNPAKVASYLGDTVAVLLETYSHFLPEDDDIGRAIMDGFLVPGSGPSGASERPENATGSA